MPPHLLDPKRDLRALEKAAGGLEYVEQPCPSVAELAAVRRRVDVRIAADEAGASIPLSDI